MAQNGEITREELSLPLLNELDGKTSIVVQNDLLATEEGNALDAVQGKTLDDKIFTLSSDRGYGTTKNFGATTIDWNNIIDNGLYRCNSWGGTQSNIPVNTLGIIQVINYFSGLLVQILYQQNGINFTRTRNHETGVWTGWKQVATSDEISILSGNGFNGTKKSLTGLTDCNTFTAIGGWQGIIDSNAVANLPPSIASKGTLRITLDIILDDTNRYSQFIRVTGGLSTQQSFYRCGLTSVWKEIATTDSVLSNQGGAVSGSVISRSWGTFEGGSNGFATLGANLYRNGSTNDYRFVNTHGTQSFACGIDISPFSREAYLVVPDAGQTTTKDAIFTYTRKTLATTEKINILLTPYTGHTIIEQNNYRINNVVYFSFYVRKTDSTAFAINTQHVVAVIPSGHLPTTITACKVCGQGTGTLWVGVSCGVLSNTGNIAVTTSTTGVTAFKISGEVVL